MSHNVLRSTLYAATFSAAILAVACSDSTTSQGTGSLRIQLTDAPFSSDSVKRVDIYVVRVDAKVADSDSSDAATATSTDSAAAGGWTTIATPNALIELLALRNGIFTTLGAKTVAAGEYKSLRLIIDPSKSSVTLKNGAVLTSTSSPSVSFPSAARSGIKIKLASPLTVRANDTTTTLVDFDVDNSFVQRGNSIAQNGLLFKPVIKATIR